MAGPLAGIKVVDFSHWGVGPWSCMILGALGASVLKIDPPNGDAIATIPPRQKGAGTTYLACNIYKENIRLDLKTKEGLDIAFRLIKEADVFVENMSPGTIERLGLGYDALSCINSRLIYVSATPYGKSGPMAKNAGIDCLLQAFSGFASITGSSGGKAEMVRFEGHLDLNSSAHLVAASLQALLMRQQDGKGRKVDVTMLGSTLKLQSSRLAEFFATGGQPRRSGSAAATTAPHRAFRCRDGRWITVGVTSEAQWRRFCLALEDSILAEDPRFHSNALRVTNSEQLYATLEGTLASNPYRWWEKQFTSFRVAHGPNLDFSSILTHREMGRHIKLVDHPLRGPYYTGSMPFAFSKTALDEPWTKADPLEPSLTPEDALAAMAREDTSIGKHDGRPG